MKDNPYLAEARAANFGRMDNTSAAPIAHAAAHLPPEEFHETLSKAASQQSSWRETRNEKRARYSYAIPDERALDILARYAPLVEIGAGVGYWAYLLRERGVDIIAYDRTPPADEAHGNGYHRYEATVGTVWTEVLRGTAVAARKHPDRTLFLCWPPFDEPMAAKALEYYVGETVAYIGEGPGGCTADNRFHRMLESEWDGISSYPLPHWDGIHDHLFIFQR